MQAPDAVRLLALYILILHYLLLITLTVYLLLHLSFFTTEPDQHLASMIGIYA
jgi:hypothetical protein